MTCKGILLDTNIYIYMSVPDDSTHKDQLTMKEKAILKIESLPETTTVFHYNLTIYKELAVGFNDRQKINRVFDLFNGSLLVECKEIMLIAAERYRHYLRDFRELRENANELIYKSKTIPNDCIIGVTALYYGVAVMTNNVKDFVKYFPEIEIIGLN